MSASVTIPLEQAIQRAKQITFRPFDLGKWFVLGFAAWLAMLGEGGGFHFNFSFPSGGGRGGGPDPMKEVWDWILANLEWVIAGVVLLVLLSIAIGLLLAWIRSRAAFIFLDNLARNEAAIVAPWRQYRPLGNSLFLFSVCLNVIALACCALIVGLSLLLAWPDIQARQFGASAITAVVAGVGLLVPAAIFVAVVGWCTNNFVAPLMYLRGQTVLSAWREFRTVLLPGNTGSFVLFFLLQLVMRLAISIAVALVCCLTCCIAAIPYLGTVITLPLHVFDRCYSVYFLEQFGPNYRMFGEIYDPASPFPLDAWPVPPNS